MKMRLTLTLLTFLLSFSFCYAQESISTSPSDTIPQFEYRGAARVNFNEISISHGHLSSYEMAMDLGEALASIIPGKKIDKINSTGAIALAYMRYLKSGRASFGAVIGYEHINASFIPKNEDEATETKTFDALTIMPSTKFVWFNRKHVGLYSRIALGVLLDIDDNVTPVFAFQANALGVDLGNEKIRGFLEMGFGNLGLIQAGLKFTF